MAGRNIQAAAEIGISLPMPIGNSPTNFSSSGPAGLRQAGR